MSKKKVLIALIVLSAAGVLTYFLIRGKGDEVTPTIEISSPDLKETVVVPTLDTPIPDGKSAIWCASFQIAWKDFETSLVKEPIRLRTNNDLARQLSDAPLPKDDLPAEMVYARCGLRRDGIVKAIQEDMKHKFPSVKVPDLGGGDGAVVYGYLQAAIPFPVPYFDATLKFGNQAERISEVKAFGIKGYRQGVTRDLWKQVDLLFGGNREWEPEFAIDLCKDSSPHQIVLAVVSKKETLAATYDEVQNKIKNRPGDLQEFSAGDHLAVPVMFWKIDHHFAELEGNFLENDSMKGWEIDRAIQTAQFKLDRGGVELKSEATILPKSASRELVFDRPYLIYMIQRGAKKPFFVMWVENSELMVK
jgi:hypothetical protein